MSLTERTKRFELSEAAPSTERPKIWVEGRQRPKFDIKAYGRATFGMAKRDLAPEILDAEGRLRRLGTRVHGGEARLDVARFGRLAQFVPSHQAVGGWILGLADVFAGSHAILVPPAAAEPVVAHPDLVRARVSHEKLRLRSVENRPAPPATEEPTLDAIRSAIGSAPHEVHLERPRSWPPLRPADPAADEGNVKDGLTARLRKFGLSVAGRTLLGLLMAFAIPGGAVRAMLFHLDGGDLADWS